ncbi:hypothetical protein Gp_5 [Bacillus phage vB_Bacillus_1020A]|uniref:hypothetical protein n=1 Tax=Robertmurraya sp. DFI.2.37 TaxID=3031819 RepID=UPI0012470BB4|nr:hypothetical protein [Robertmurraya sp. DFI.2.37]MDF1511449.1 hypothetical protein [Robertmurraya sp. DFI.2.37]QIW89279.1 hypothetical protein Gp_5 [Bacillus phage vB_Bacillus_1020A]
MERCKVPECRKEVHDTWALVPLCKEHYEDMKIETHRYYHGKGGLKISHEEREIFHSIAHEIPWARRTRV